MEALPISMFYLNHEYKSEGVNVILVPSSYCHSFKFQVRTADFLVNSTDPWTSKLLVLVRFDKETKSWQLDVNPEIYRTYLLLVLKKGVHNFKYVFKYFFSPVSHSVAVCTRSCSVRCVCSPHIWFRWSVYLLLFEVQNHVLNEQ